MRPTLGEKLTWARMNELLNRLPFRGRLLFFLGGAFVGGGGLAGASLYLRSEEAARPPEDDDQLLRPLLLQPRFLPLSGTGRRWAGWGSSWGRPLPHWSPAALELLESGVLLVSPLAGARRAAGTSAAGAVRSNGRRSVAIPLHRANVTEDSSTNRIKIEMKSGEIEHLQLNSEVDLGEWSDALKRGKNEGKSAGSTKRRTRRIVDVSYPRTWEKPYDEFRLVKLHRHSEEYKRVSKLAIEQQYRKDSNSTSPYVKGKISVQRVWRVQTPRLWEEYCMRRAIIAAENNGDPCEKLLWHGTNATEVVLRKGLDPRVCSLNGLFGGGVYFADKSTKSVRYTGAYKRGDTGQLMLCRVSLGRQMVKRWPSPGLRRPPNPWPLYPSQIGPWWRDKYFHSLFAPSSYLLLMNEYIVYHCNQGVPEYVVDFKLV